MPTSSSDASRITFRTLFGKALLLVVGTLPAVAAAGELQIATKDVNSHVALSANLTLQGPQSISVRTNDNGRIVLTLQPGEYLIAVSAASYKTSKTHYNVGEGANLPFTIFLEPESLPSEEQPDSLSVEVQPGFTLLHGYAVDAETGRPIPGVKVRSKHEKVETTTNLKGHYTLSIPTPVSEYPGGLGVDTLIFEKNGYSTEVFENFGISGDEMGGTGLEMEKGNQVHKHDATHKLMKNEPSNTEEPQSAKPALKTPHNIRPAA